MRAASQRLEMDADKSSVMLSPFASNKAELVQLEFEIKQQGYNDQEYTDKCNQLDTWKATLTQLQNDVDCYVQKTTVGRHTIENLESELQTIFTSAGNMDEMWQILLKIEVAQARELIFLRRCVKSRATTHTDLHANQ